MAQRWYLIRTRPRCERLALLALEREGFEFFFPRVRTPLRRAPRGGAPLFPGYVFLRHDVESRDWTSVRRLPGILGWVHFGGVVPPVPDEVITDLVGRVEAINREGGLWSRFRPGDRVRVTSGKIETLAEVVEEPKSPGARVRVLLECMGRQVPAQVPSRDLSSAEAYSGAGGGRVRRTRGGGRWIRGFGPRTATA